eukprot:PhF_6_TR40814/c0_g1_i2/m.61713
MPLRCMARTHTRMCTLTTVCTTNYSTPCKTSSNGCCEKSPKYSVGLPTLNSPCFQRYCYYQIKLRGGYLPKTRSRQCTSLRTLHASSQEASLVHVPPSCTTSSCVSTFCVCYMRRWRTLASLLHGQSLMTFPRQVVDRKDFRIRKGFQMCFTCWTNTVPSNIRSKPYCNNYDSKRPLLFFSFARKCISNM